MISLLLTTLLSTPDASARDISLDDALAMARQSNVQVRVADLEVDAARAQAHQVRSYYLPTVTLRGAALWWDDALEAQIISADVCDDLDSLYQDLCSQFIGGLGDEPILLREQATQRLSAEARWPITGLWGVHAGHRATRSLQRAARQDAQAQRAAAATDVVDAYLMALRVRELHRVASSAVATLQAHRDRAQAFHEAGLIDRDELLQVQVALGDARVDLLRVETGTALADRALAVLTGADDSDLHPLPLPTATLPPIHTPDDLGHLTDQRPDVLAMQARAQAAQANQTRATSELLPQVAGVANWTRNWGVGSLAANHEAYVGLGLEWDVWGWGRRVEATREAAAHAQQARVGLAGLRRGAALQAQVALNQAHIAQQVWEARQGSVAQALENQQIVSARFDAHSLTSAELLQAETLYTKAQSDVIGAFFDALSAIAHAQEQLGLPVAPLAGVP